MEERNLKILFGKSGNGYLTPRISLPISWIKDMNLSPTNRDVIAKYDEKNKQIVIEKEK